MNSDNNIGTEATARVREILSEAKRLAVEYYRLIGKPLGITGEVAEYVAAETLGLKLAPLRNPGDRCHPFRHD
jgi:hypothetical protein